MSRNHPSTAAVLCAERATRVTMLLAAMIMAGCERGNQPGASRTASGDSASAARNDTTPAGLPPGFSSAQGTPAPVPARAIASAAIADSLAPPPSAALTARISTDEQNAIKMLPAGSGHDVVVGNCLTCHSVAMLEQQHKDATAWNKTVSQMMAWGTPVSAGQKPILIAYLASHFGARAPASPSPASPSP
jgi:cytochrome c5